MLLRAYCHSKIRENRLDRAICDIRNVSAKCSKRTEIDLLKSRTSLSVKPAALIV